MYKFIDEDLDNLIEFNNNFKKEKEEKDLEYLINTRKILFIIPLVFSGESLKLNFSKKNLENTFNNEYLFKNWARKWSINKITLKLDDKPDLRLVINDRDQENGIELTTVYPFKKNKNGDIVMANKNIQQLPINQISFLLKDLRSKGITYKIKVDKNANEKIKFIQFKGTDETKKKIEEKIKGIKNWDKINSATFCNKYDAFDHIDNETKKKLFNNYKENLNESIKTKNKQVLNYETKNNTLLIIVEDIEDFIIFGWDKDGGGSECGSTKIWNESKKLDCCDHYFEKVYSEAIKKGNNFNKIIIIYKNNLSMPPILWSKVHQK